jgi:nitrogen fixation NifU-like protein
MSDLRDLYQEVILDHNKSPRNFRELPAADRHAHGDNPLCGDVVTIYVGLDQETLREVTFQGSGCAISQASASMMTDAVRGKTVAEARALARQFRTLLTEDGGPEAGLADPAALGKLAVFSGVKDYPMRVKCATLAWHTLAAALEGKQDPVSTET